MRPPEAIKQNLSTFGDGKTFMVPTEFEPATIPLTFRHANQSIQPTPKGPGQESSSKTNQ